MLREQHKLVICLWEYSIDEKGANLGQSTWQLLQFDDLLVVHAVEE
jgi:hypothetical protein